MSLREKYREEGPAYSVGSKTQNSSQNVLTTTTHEFQSRHVTEFMSGVNIPNFHSRKRRGELLPHTHFHKVRKETVCNGGSLSAIRKTSDYWLQWNNYPSEVMLYIDRDGTPTGRDMEFYIPTPDTSFHQSYVQAAAQRIYSKGWDALTFAGEMPSLKKQFSRIATRLAKLTNNNASKRILSLWLESRYGWRTLAYDIRDFSNAIRDADFERELFSERAGFSYKESGTASWNNTLQSHTQHIEMDWNASHSIRGSVTGRIKPAHFIVDPLKTGWELIPLSFVLDWVIQVGTAIDAMQFVRHASEYAASYGYLTEFNYSSRIDDVTDADTWGCSAYASALGNAFIEQRTPTDIQLLPQVNPRPLTGDIGLDLISLARLRARL